MHAERPDVRPRLARNPEYGEMAIRIVLQQPRFVYGSDPKLPLHRGNERRALEQCASQGINGRANLRNARLAMKPRDCDVLLPCPLLRLDQPRRAVDAHNKASSHLGVQSAAVPSLLHAQDTLDPRHDLVRGGVGGLEEREREREKKRIGSPCSSIHSFCCRVQACPLTLSRLITPYRM